MHDCIKRMLKPLFQLLAAPGLGNPHSFNPHGINLRSSSESELMAVGAKPVAIMFPTEVTAQMQKAIDNGHIVKINEQKCITKYRIYCQPSEIKQVRNSATILQDIFQNGDFKMGPEDDQKLSFWKKALKTDVPNVRGQIVHEHNLIRSSSIRGETTPASEALLAGEILAMPPILFNEKQAPNTVLEKAVAEGKLASVEFETSQVTAVFAQSNKIEDGKELFARYYKGDVGYDPLGDQKARRVGQLLGFTENDLAWHYSDKDPNPKYTNPILRDLMEKTHTIRIYARHQVMLMDAPRPEFAEHHRS